MGKGRFIQKAIRRPGALRARLGVKEGSTIPRGRLIAERTRLRNKAKTDKGLTSDQTRFLRQVNLALTLRKF